MEVDREIVRHFGDVIVDGINSVAKQSLKTGLCVGAAGYLTYRVSKRCYISYTVNSAAQKLRKEFEESQARLLVSIDSWRQSNDYKDLQASLGEEDIEKFITSLDFEELVAKLQSGHVSAYAALKSYQIRAMECTRLNNNIVGWIEGADQRARELDLIAPEARKPFHGLPISIKECFFVENTYSNAGMMKFFGPKDTLTSPTVQNFINLGATPFCKTNVPQAMYSMECTNPLYGTTTNPHNPLREAGGSSGGEGSLIGGGGSIVGLGSDIGGSLRSPAACCGVYSMKPTIGRHLSYQDVVESAGPEPAGCNAIGGFMAASPRAIEYCWRQIWNMPEADSAARFDGSIAPVAFNEVMFKRKVRVGFFTSEGLFAPVPGVERAVLQAKQILERNNYQVVPVQPPSIKEVLRLFSGIVIADIETLVEYMAWDTYSSSMRGLSLTISLLQLPRWLRRLVLDPLMACLTRLPALQSLFTTTRQLFKGLQDKEVFSRRYFEEMDQEGVDVIICPAQFVPALPLGVAGTFMPIIAPYLAWNILNMPAGIAPVTRYSEADAAAMKSYPTDDLTYRMVHKYCAGAEGLPLAVQVVAKPFHEEQVLQVLNLLEQHSNYKL